MSCHILALMRAEAVTRQADVIAAMTLEVLKGTSRAFDAGELFFHVFSVLFLFSFLGLSVVCQ